MYYYLVINYKRNIKNLGSYYVKQDMFQLERYSLLKKNI